jgi:ATP-dependent exoDNAse (exonuclease V) alpha subunit
MLSARAFSKLTAHARERGARMLLVGDERQVSAVEAGNPFLDVQKETKTTFASLSESVRQRTPKLQKVVSHLYAREHEEGAKGLRQETLEAPTREARCKLAAEAYLSLPRGEQAKTLLLASTNEERQLVTAGVRAGLAEQGRLKGETTITTLRALDFADVHKKQATNYLPGYVVKFLGTPPSWGKRGEAYEIVGVNVKENTLRLRDEKRKERVIACETLTDATLYRKEQIAVAMGDRVVWTQNDKRVCALNNDFFEVSKVSKAGVTLHRAGDEKNGRLMLSLDGLHHLDHAWAMTMYRSQGQTTKNVILVADEGMSARELLVGVTRATQGVLIVAHDREDIERMISKKGGKHIAHEVAVEVPSVLLDSEERRAGTEQAGCELVSAVPRAPRAERAEQREQGAWEISSF